MPTTRETTHQHFENLKVYTNSSKPIIKHLRQAQKRHALQLFLSLCVFVWVVVVAFNIEPPSDAQAKEKAPPKTEAPQKVLTQAIEE
jgi:hypothetical protein